MSDSTKFNSSKLKLIKGGKYSLQENSNHTYKEPDPYLKHLGCSIDDNTEVIVYEYCNPSYYDVVLARGSSEYLIGRYAKETNNLLVDCRFNKVLIYSAKFDPVNGGLSLITKVIALYNYHENMFYSLTEDEALRLFNRELDRSNLKNPNNLLVDNDIRFKKKVLDINKTRYIPFDE